MTSLNAPIACTLEAGSLKERLASIATLNAGALRAARREDLKLILDYDRAAADDVQRMVEAEQACCAFLAFDLRNVGGVIRLTITAPPEAREAAEMLFEPFASREVTSGALGCGCNGGCGE